MRAAIVYATFAPFHRARLRAAGEFGQEMGHNLVGIEVAGRQRDYGWRDEEEADRRYEHIKLFPGDEYWSVPVGGLQRRLFTILDELHPDVLLLPGWAFRESLIALVWSLSRRVARVVISDSQGIDSPQTLLRVWWKKFIVRRFDSAFVGGKPHIRYLNDLGIPRDRCFVGCDVVDNKFFGEGGPRVREQRWGGHAGPLLLSCLRLLPRKNVLSVLEVLARQPQWSWVIAGEGPQRRDIERRIERLGLQDRVRLLGHVPYAVLPRLYAGASIYVQPSLVEPWGLAVNEAMASGLPVLVSQRCGCHEDLIQPGINGYTFDVAASEEFSHALDRMAQSRSMWSAMGEASRCIISDWGLDLFARNFWLACTAALERGSRAVKVTQCE